jgi:hypothetical protein
VDFGPDHGAVFSGIVQVEVQGVWTLRWQTIRIEYAALVTHLGGHRVGGTQEKSER